MIFLLANSIACVLTTVLLNILDKKRVSIGIIQGLKILPFFMASVNFETNLYICYVSGWNTKPEQETKTRGEHEKCSRWWGRWTNTHTPASSSPSAVRSSEYKCIGPHGTWNTIGMVYSQWRNGKWRNGKTAIGTVDLTKWRVEMQYFYVFKSDQMWYFTKYYFSGSKFFCSIKNTSVQINRDGTYD
jgi:hypothetical protein